MELETMTVVAKDGTEVVINKTDFDPSVHTEKKPEPVKAEKKAKGEGESSK